MNASEETLLQQMAAMIVREVAPETIIPFGSWARGEVWLCVGNAQGCRHD